LGNFGTFNLNMFRYNINLATITYIQGATGWDSTQRTFMPETGPTGSVTAEAAAPPATPAAPTATAGDSQVSVTWIKPADGGSTITGYTVTSAPDGNTCTTSDADTLTCAVTGLTNGTAYTFTVTATNGVGTSAASALSSSVTPAALPATAFDVDGFSYNVINATDVEVTGRASGNTATDIVIPATASDGPTTYSVTTIGQRAFERNALTSVIIGNSVKTIGIGAFNDNALTSVIIGNSVTTIGESAFQQNALTSVIIPDSVTTIEDFAFSNNYTLTSVIIPDSVTTIGEEAFRNNALTSVIIGNSVTTIGESAFQGNSLTSVIIGNSVTSIGVQAFQYNPLTSLIIPDSVTSIGGQAFAFNALTSVIIPDSVTTIGIGAFGSNALTSVIIPDSVTTIGEYAFADNNLTSVAFLGNFGTFELNMFGGFGGNPTLTTITYCEGTTGWPQGFYDGSTTITSTAVNCSAFAPDAPQITNTDYGNEEIYLTVSDSGSSPITSYTATCTDGTTPYRGTSSTSRITVSGLTNGVGYSCSVTATNAVGTSSSSASSPPIVPEYIPTGLPIWLLYEASKPASP
jgi:hypothetical protein